MRSFPDIVFWAAFTFDQIDDVPARTIPFPGAYFDALAFPSHLQSDCVFVGHEIATTAKWFPACDRWTKFSSQGWILGAA